MTPDAEHQKSEELRSLADDGEDQICWDTTDETAAEMMALFRSTISRMVPRLRSAADEIERLQAELNILRRENDGLRGLRGD